MNTIPTPRTTNSTGQPRERAVPCQSCGVTSRRGRVEPRHTTWNASADCKVSDAEHFAGLAQARQRNEVAS